MHYGRMRARRLLLTTSSALALIASLNSGAEAASCASITVPATDASADCIVISGPGNDGNFGSTNNAISSDLTIITSGITNSGTILGGVTNVGIIVGPVSTFTGGVTNTGTITPSPGLEDAIGIYLTSISTFFGGVGNTGTILETSGTQDTFGIYLTSIGTLFGGVANSGTIVTSSATEKL